MSAIGSAEASSGGEKAQSGESYALFITSTGLREVTESFLR